MSKTILLSNLGNRNIRVKNKEYKDDFIPNKKFREETETLLNNYENEKDNIELNILPSILDEYKGKNVTLYLFCTNQTEPNNKQDTLFEAQIIAKKIEENYSDIEVYIEELKEINPTNEEELISGYTKFTKRHLQNECQIVYYDSGGTPQQKNSIRSVLEFYIAPERLNQYYGANENGETILRKLERSASEELKLKRQVRNLMNTYHYSSSLVLAEDMNLSMPLIQLNKMAILLWNNLQNDFKNKYEINRLNKGVKSHPRIEDFKIAYPNEKFDLYYEYKSFLLLNKFHTQRKINNFSGAVLTLQQIIETYVLGKLSELVSIDLANSKRYHLDSESVLDEILIEFGSEIKKEYGKNIKSLSLPIELIYLGIHPDLTEEEKSLINEFKSVISTLKGSIPNNQRLDVLRNAIVHRGKGVTENVIDKYYKDLVEKLDTYLEYDSSNNIYDIINEMSADFL